MAAAGRIFADAGVAAIYLVHGTFVGNDALGLLTELARYAPATAERLRRLGKRVFDALLGETGNYTREFAARMEGALGAAAGRSMPVRLFYWASQNHHASRADAAVLFIDELARMAEQLERGQTASRDVVAQIAAQPPAGGARKRVMLWAHSHGGNVLALVTNLLGADEATRAEFFERGRTLYRRWHSGRVDFPAWQRVAELLADARHPVRRLQLDMVNFGTPIRYGWDSTGYERLLHVTHHVPTAGTPEYLASFPPPWLQILRGTAGDFIQQVGITGSNLAPLPIAVRTFLGDLRLGQLFQRGLPSEWLFTRLKRGMRVPEEGTTLLVDYEDPDGLPFRHLLGHAPYTRSRWMAFHCEQIAGHFYGHDRAVI